MTVKTTRRLYHMADDDDQRVRELRGTEIPADAPKRRGRPADPNRLIREDVYLPRHWWEWLDRWPGANPSEKMRTMFEYVTAMRPDGPEWVRRDEKGRFTK